MPYRLESLAYTSASPSFREPLPHGYCLQSDFEALRSQRHSIFSPTYNAVSTATDVSSRFGRRLRELRKERQLTQIDMAKRFGIDRSYISDVERGKKSVSLPMLEILALGLKVSLSDLFRDI